MINDDVVGNYLDLIHQGYSQRKACELLGVPRSTMQDMLKKNEKYFADLNDKVGGNKGPKTLVLDLESAPALLAGWGRFNMNFSQDNVVKEGDYLLTAAWKWLGEDSSSVAFIGNKQDRWDGNDLDVVTAVWDALNEADIVIGQNVKSFDLGLIKARCAYHGLPPFKTVKVIDTLHIAKTMKFPSNKLDSLAAYLGIGRKVQHSGIDLWLKVMKGDEEALEKMIEYNIGDIMLTEEVYLRLRAFNQRPVNFAHYYDDEEPRCSVCGSDDLDFTGKKVYTEVSEFEEVVCKSCGHRHRTRKAINTKEKRKNILVTPR